jgi:tripartite-type tricarboxylate transporter receptor subunit TctC
MAIPDGHALLPAAPPFALNHRSPGVGGINRRVLKSLKARTHTAITHIPCAASHWPRCTPSAPSRSCSPPAYPGLAPHIREGTLKALAQVVQMPDVKERPTEDALNPATGTLAQLGRFLQKDATSVPSR